MSQIAEYRKDNLYITMDMKKIEIEAVCSLLKQSYWANTRQREVIIKSLENSLCFFLFEKEKHIGLIRVISDYATFAYLCDVIIDEEYRHRGIGEWFLQCAFEHPDLQNLRRWCLATSDAHKFYEKFGFRGLSHPENFMEIFNG